MNEEKGKVLWIVPVLVVVVILGAYFFNWEIGARLHPEHTTSDMAELSKMISDQIDAGETGGVFYLSDINIDDIMNINDYIISLNGSVDQYIVLYKRSNKLKVQFKYDISDNYYAYQKYKNNMDIPADRPAAQKLYEQMSVVINQVIKPGMTDYEKELAIHDYIVTHCEYGYTDGANEYAFRAYGVLVHGKAVCNGYAEAMTLLLNCVDVENEIMTGYADGELHAWNRVKLDGKWYQVDATWDDPIPDRIGYAGHIYMNVTDDIMDDMHEWNKEDYEPCDSMDYNYFKLNNMIGNYDEFKSKVEFMAMRDRNAIIEYVLTDYNANTYDMSQIANVDGVYGFTYIPENYGPYEVMTINLNKR